MKARQAAYPGLTLTEMYNVLEKLRGGDLRSPSINGDETSPPSSRRMGGVIWRSRHKTPRHKTQDKRNSSPASSPSTTSARRKRSAASSAGSARNTSVGAISGRPPPPRKPTTSPAPRSRLPNPKSTINNPQSSILNQQSTINNQQSTINNQQSRTLAPRPRRPGRRDPETPPRHRRERHGHLRLLRQEIQAPRSSDRGDPGDPALAREARVKAREGEGRRGKKRRAIKPGSKPLNDPLSLEIQGCPCGGF